MSYKSYELKWTRDKLWEGCMLASIAHAIMVAHYPELSNEHSWDGMNYNVQNSAGARGTVTFHSQYCIAAFRDDNSDRIATGVNFTQANEYFKNASKEITNLAQIETLQYMLDYVDGKTIPVITSAFWGTITKLYSVDIFEELIKNGGFLLEIQTMDFEAAREAWKEYYEMSPEQCKLLESIYKRKVARPRNTLILSKSQINLIGSDDIDGLKESKVSFKEIGIQWEE